MIKQGMYDDNRSLEDIGFSKDENNEDTYTSVIKAPNGDGTFKDDFLVAKLPEALRNAAEHIMSVLYFDKAAGMYTANFVFLVSITDTGSVAMQISSCGIADTPRAALAVSIGRLINALKADMKIATDTITKDC